MAKNIQNKSVVSFSFIGAGNLGVPLIHALVLAGFNLKYVYKKSKDSSLIPFLQFSLDLLIEESDCIFIAVQESKIASIVKEIARVGNLENKIFFHVSNSLTSDELVTLKQKGAFIASFSPLQTFPYFQNQSKKFFKDIFFLLEGDPYAKKIARQMAEAIRAKILEVKKKDKVFIHLAAIAVSNFLVSLFLFAEEQLEKTTIKGKTCVLIPLCQETLSNISKKGILNSLSGPIARGEKSLVKKHIQLLQGIEGHLYRDHCKFLATYKQRYKKML